MKQNKLSPLAEKAVKRVIKQMPKPPYGNIIWGVSEQCAALRYLAQSAYKHRQGNSTLKRELKKMPSEWAYASSMMRLLQTLDLI